MIAAVIPTWANRLSGGNSQIGRMLFVFTQWVYTALNKQQLFYENLTERRLHCWLLREHGAWKHNNVHEARWCWVTLSRRLRLRTSTQATKVTCTRLLQKGMAPVRTGS